MTPACEVILAVISPRLLCWMNVVCICAREAEFACMGTGGRTRSVLCVVLHMYLRGMAED